MSTDQSRQYDGCIVHEDGSISDEAFHAELLDSPEGNAASYDASFNHLLKSGLSSSEIVAEIGTRPLVLKALGQSAVRERQIDFVLQEEFDSNASFLDQFLTLCQDGQSSQGDHAIAHESLSSVRDKTGETDLLVSYRFASDAPNSRRVLLIEDKVDAAFGSRQAERYRERGENGIKEHLWSSYKTCLVAPRAYIGAQHGFDYSVPLEAILPLFAPDSAKRKTFKQGVIQHAIEEQARQGLKEEDVAVTAFRLAYFEAYQDFLSTLEEDTRRQMLDIIPPKPRKAWRGDTWFHFRSPALGKRVYINHKAEARVIDLTFAYTEAEVLRARVQITPEMEIKQTGKSAAIRLAVPFLNCHGRALEQAPQLREAFLAVTRLALFFKSQALYDSD